MSTTHDNWNTGSHGYSAGWSDYGGDYHEVVRRKEEWSSPSLLRAFDENTPWSIKQVAMRRFEAVLAKVRRRTLKYMGTSKGIEDSRVKPQLAAAYTHHPVGPQAAIGHTAFLEIVAELKQMMEGLARGLLREEVAMRLGLRLDTYALTCQQVAQALVNRQVLYEASGRPSMACIELYRLFQASVHKMEFRLLSDLIDAVVIFGDVLPDYRELHVHAMTRQLLGAMTQASQPHWSKLDSAPAEELNELFAAWGRDLIEALTPFLPREKEETGETGSAPATGNPDSGEAQEGPKYRYGSDEKEAGAPSGRISPLDEPQVPRIADKSKAAQLIPELLERVLSETNQKNNPDKEEAAGQNKELSDAMQALNQAATAASDQSCQWEDMRHDLLQDALARDPFGEGPIEGNLSQGNNVELSLGDDHVGGQVFERTVSASQNPMVVEKLRREAMPVSRALRRNLYPSISELPEVEHICTSGQLDPQRMALAGLSEAVFRRCRIHRQPDPQGRATLVIAADASSSLSPQQMRMCKCLVTAWLDSTHRTTLRVLAALYHSGEVRKHSHGPLVQWVYHPRKSAMLTASEAVRAVATLPDHGTGAQSDALQLAHILDEAAIIAHGSQVYLVIISDCAWNKSFLESNLAPVQEVARTLDTKRQQFNNRLHITLVALQAQAQEEIRKVADAVLCVNAQELGDPAAVAGRIGEYVASCIRERRAV